MKISFFHIPVFVSTILLAHGTLSHLSGEQSSSETTIAQPVTATQPVSEDSDDPAIWINSNHPEKSLVIGTDKVYATGGLYVFDLSGKIVQHLAGLDRPNNVDVEYDFQLGGKKVDLAVTTERGKSRLRIFAINKESGVLQDVSGNTRVFPGESGDLASPMGIGLYRNPKNGFTYAIVSRKSGHQDGYLHVYKLLAVGGKVSVQYQTSFGKYSGSGEIEAIAVEDKKGWVAYSDEGYGIQVYSIASILNGKPNLIATLGTEGYMGDREGLVFLRDSKTNADILLSTDQIENASEIKVYDCNSWNPNPIKTIRTPSDTTDGIDASSVSLGKAFKDGVIVMMNSKDKNFLYYDLKKFLGTP